MSEFGKAMSSLRCQFCGEFDDCECPRCNECGEVRADCTCEREPGCGCLKGDEEDCQHGPNW